MPDNHSDLEKLLPLGRSLGDDDEGLLAAMEVLSERITMSVAGDKPADKEAGTLEV